MPDAVTGPAFQEALSATAQIFMREEDLQTAIDRFIGLPVPLPVSLIKTIKSLSSEDSRALVKQLLTAASSPISRIHLLYILLCIDDDTSAYHRLARRVITSFFSAKGIADFEAFLAVLKWVNEEFGRRQDFRSFSPHIRLALIWSHTHQLFSILISTGAPTTWFKEAFGQIGQQIRGEVFERDPDYWFDIAHPRRVNRETFFLEGLSYSLGEATTGFIEKKLRGLFTKEFLTEMAGRQFPFQSLLRDPAQARNSLGSFLGDDYRKGLSLLLDDKDQGQFMWPSFRELAEQAVNKLTEASDELLAWVQIYAVFGDLPPYEDLMDQLKVIMCQTDFVNLFEKDLNCGKFAIHAASLQVINLDDEDLRYHLKDQLVNIAKFLTAQKSSKLNCIAADERELFLVLVESALNISIAAQLPQDVISEFADLLRQLVETWDSMMPECRPMVQRLCEELPISQAQKFWPLLVRLRAE